MYIGAIFDHKSKQYKIKKINNDGVYASKIVDGKCQIGRPSRFTHQDVAKSLNIAVEKLQGPPPKPKPKPEVKVDTPVRHIKLIDEDDELDEAEESSPEDEERRLKSIQRLLDLLEDETTVDDW